ncbi:glycosyltransferase family 2 protein [Pectobacterium brasiliense]|uniref:glycosyltransferase family 2 protein n=2 Tax=Pectobacterium brasiliense TaxID=180957 RepID=UPI00209D8A5B|nr:glycosyltransferase family 2 protein [Pectobacterium brasiliense]
MMFLRADIQEVFSIIMPAYNAEATVDESIRSVLEQTFVDFKLYVVDDGSTDNTRNIIKSYIDSRIVYVEKNNNTGVASARNLAINMSRGKYITFLDSDDIWTKEKLERQIIYLNEGFDVVCSNYEVFCSAINKENEKKINFPKIITYDDMLKSNFIGNLTGAYNTESLGKFYQKSVGHEDYVMWLEIMKKAKRAYCIQENLAYYRTSSSSLSGNKIKALLWQWNIYRNEVKLSFVSSCYFFLCYVFYALKKRKN